MRLTINQLYNNTGITIKTETWTVKVKRAGMEALQDELQSSHFMALLKSILRRCFGLGLKNTLCCGISIIEKIICSVRAQYGHKIWNTSRLGSLKTCKSQPGGWSYKTIIAGARAFPAISESTKWLIFLPGSLILVWYSVELI